MRSAFVARIRALTGATSACLALACGAAFAQPIDGLFDGCTEVLNGPRCVLPASGHLVVWLDLRDATRTTWRLDETVVTPATVVATADGHRFTFALGARAGRLRATGLHDEALFALDLTAPIEISTLEAANDAMAAGHYDDALNLLDDALTQASAAQTAALLRARARVHSRRGDKAASHRDYRAAIGAAAMAGQQHTGLLCALALGFSLRHDDGDLDAARRVLTPFDPAASGHASGRYFLSYHAGMIAYRAGNVRRHLALMRDAARIAERFGWADRALRADTRLAVQWQNLGRREKARQLLDGWRERLPATLPGCEQAFFWTNLGWAHLLELEAGEDSIDPEPVLQRARELADAHCPLTEQVNARVNLGLAHWHAGRTDDADDALRAAHALSAAPAAHIVHWSLDLAARIARSRGRPDEALALYDELALRSDAAALPATRWRALARRGWVLESSGRLDDALRAYEQAQDALDDEVLRVPVHEGRETLLATRRFASLRQLDLLLNAGDNEGALALVSRDRGRTLRLAHVAARLERLDGDERERWERAVARHRAQRDRLSREQAQSWTLSRQALADLRVRAQRDDARLGYELDEAIAALDLAGPGPSHSPKMTDTPVVAFVRAASGWAALIKRAGTVTASRPDCGLDAGTALAACLLRAVAHRLEDITDIRLLVDDTLADVAWQALPLGDGDWIDRATIRYAVDLPVTARATPAPGNAVLVGDPTGNLRAARAEITDVRQRLGTAGDWSGQVLTGDQVISATVRAALPGAALFHYAGHASYGDELGWDSALELAAGTRFGIGDILTLEGTPQLVVLSGCETARRPGLMTPTMGLANAFIAAGSSAVIATTRPVDDASARAVTLAFYDHWLAGAQIGHALRAAQLQIRNDQPQLDWSAFRLIEP